MNNQEAFDAAVNHLRKQGCRSQPKYSTDCLYRGPKGLKCAIGALIPDELYKPTYEGTAICVLVHKVDGISNLFRNADIDMLVTLQNIHDTMPVERWEHLFECTAKSYGLTLPVKAQAGTPAGTA